jgi:conjugal transfer pilus assembly protein TraA
MNLTKKLRGTVAAISAAVLAAPAMASTTAGGSSDAFYTFYETVQGWTGGALGMGLATTMLLMGGAIGVAKNTPMPALTGVAGAAFLHWGPDIIRTIMVNGGLM